MNNVTKLKDNRNMNTTKKYKIEWVLNEQEFNNFQTVIGHAPYIWFEIQTSETPR